jgi:hypothetical protein
MALFGRLLLSCMASLSILDQYCINKLTDFRKTWYERYGIFGHFVTLNFSSITHIIFWDITPRIPVKLNQGFGGAHRLHIQGR